MTQEADGLYFGPKHLKQTTPHYSQFIENGQAKLGQHYLVLTNLWLVIASIQV